MQGIILNITKVKEEDLIVTLITKKRLKTLYRFYGARHSSINLGFMIDFIPVYSSKSNIAMLREVLHLGFSWQFDRDKFFLWQQFIKLLYKHLKDVDELDSFYFELLEEAIKKIKLQNPKRVLVECYLKLLDYEGRLQDEFKCFICGDDIKESSILKRSYLLSCKRCLRGYKFENKKLKELFDSKSTILFSDEEVDRLWEVLLEGI